jgi:hypothetical protein
MAKDCWEDGCDCCDILGSWWAAFKLLLEDVTKGCAAVEDNEPRCECADPGAR